MRTIQFILLSFFFTGLTNAQQVQNTLSGKVFSASTNMPIAEVEVEIINLNTKAYTNEEGYYQLPFTGEEVWLNFSYPGYTSKQILVNTPGERNIYLTEAKFESSDSYVPGLFGNIFRYKNASYSYLRKDALKSSTYSNPELAIQGRLAGVNVKAISGMPGEGGIINFRGISSIFGENNPLVVIDGVPVSSNILESGVSQGVFYNPLNSIDINDIEKIEVLKDGSAIYGLQGGNGVVLITTNQPASVNTRIVFSAFAGLTSKPEYIKTLSAPEHKAYLIYQLQSEGKPYSGILQQNPWISGNPGYNEYYNFANNTNWQDEIFSMARVNKYNASLEGGDEIARFSVSLGFLDQEGIIKNTGFQRYTFRFNSTVKILEKLSMASSISFAYSNTDQKNLGPEPGLNPITEALLKPPMFAPYLRDIRGNRISLLGNADQYGHSNPTAIVEKTDLSSFESNLLANVKLNYNLAPGFNLSSLFGVSFDNTKENIFVPDYGIIDFNNGQIMNFAREGVYKSNSFVNETSVDYTNTLDYKHFITAKGGLRIQSLNAGYNKGSVFNTPTDEFKSLSSVSATNRTLLDGTKEVINRSDLFLSGGYRLKDRYLLDLAVSLSGSSNAGEDAEVINFIGGKWGLFPSVNAGWILSSEPFLKDIGFINLLKIRTSYSIAGNDFYSDYFSYGYNSRPYGVNSGLVRTYIPNKTLKWEEISLLNIGLDAAFVNDRFRFSIDFYRKTTDDLLTQQKTHELTGFNYIWINSGSLSTEGMDASANLRLITGTFNLSLGGNINLNNSVLTIPENIILDVPGGHVIMESGSNPFSFYGLQTEGIYQTAADASLAGLQTSTGVPFRAGDVRFTNMDDNTIINSDDRTAIGNMFPKMTGGLYLDISYKFLSLNILADYSQGSKIFNYTRMLSESLSGYSNQTIAARHAWVNEETITDIPRLDFNNVYGNASFSDRWIEDGSFIRLKEVSLSLSIPPRSFYKSLTIYIAAQNLLNSNKYLGYYPEFAYSSNPALQGIDYGQMPITPFYLTGIKVGF